MGGQCCSSEANKLTNDGMQPGVQTQNTRKLESMTKAKESQDMFDSAKASFSTDVSRDRADTYAEMIDSRGSNRSGSSFAKQRGLSITIPTDANQEKNPNFKTPVGEVGSYDSGMPGQDVDDDAESEMMVMQPSDSMSSMGSQMVRMDSNAALSQTNSFQNIHELNKDLSKQKLAAAGSATQFVAVDEESDGDDESVIQRVDGVSVDDDDDESVMQRVVDDKSEATSIMQRNAAAEAASDASESVMQRVADDATSQSESIMQRAEDDDSSAGGNSFNRNPSSTHVPKELRTLGRDQGSVSNLGVGNFSSANLGSGIRSTANLKTNNF